MIPISANGRRRSFDTFLPARHHHAVLQEVTIQYRVRLRLTVVAPFRLAAAVPCIAQDGLESEADAGAR